MLIMMVCLLFCEAANATFPLMTEAYFEQSTYPIQELNAAASLSERIIHTKIGRSVVGALAAAGLATGLSVSEAAPAQADTTLVYTVVNPDHDSTNSIYDRNSPSMADTTRSYPDYSNYGDQLELICGTDGESVGPNNNRRWHLARNISRPEAGETYIPDRYLNTPNKANEKTPGEPECDSAPLSNLGNNTINPQEAEKIKPFISMDRNAAANWALAHAEDVPPEAGACTQFVSRALWKAGIPETAEWNSKEFSPSISNGDLKRRSAAAWLAPELVSYFQKQPYAEFSELNVKQFNIPKARKGDFVAYDWSGDGSIDHLSLIVGAAENNPQYPLVAEWGVYGSKPVNYNERGWTWSKKNNSWLQDEREQQNIRAYLIHFRTEDDL